MVIDPEQFGRYAKTVEILSADMTELKGDVREMKDMLAQRAGERRVGVWFGHAFTGIAASVISAFIILWLKN